MNHKPLIAVALAAIASPAVASGPVEVHYSVTLNVYTRDLFEFTTIESRVHSWEVSVGNHYKVTGSPYQAITPWRLLFANLANNSWQATNTYSEFLTSGSTVVNREDYYTRTGANVFVPGEAESMASRSLDERVTDVLYWDYK